MMKLVQSHVGMIVQSTTLDTEAKVIAIYGGASWSKIEERFLLGASSSYAVNSTGGEVTHKLTISEMPSHGHNIYVANNADFNVTPTATGNPGWHGNVISTAGTGGNQAHNNMPPYKAVYIGERTA